MQVDIHVCFSSSKTFRSPACGDVGFWSYEQLLRKLQTKQVQSFFFYLQNGHIMKDSVRIEKCFGFIYKLQLGFKLRSL